MPGASSCDVPVIGSACSSSQVSNSRGATCLLSASATPVAATHENEHEHTHGYIADKDRYLARMKRIEGQARGIHRMIDEDTYCIDILTQISALTSALQGVAVGLLEDHLRHCVTDAARAGGDIAEEKIKEASQAIGRLVR